MDTTLNCREVMKVLRVSRSTVRAMMARGDLRGFQRGKVIRIDRRSVERLLAGGATKAAEARKPAA